MLSPIPFIVCVLCLYVKDDTRPVFHIHHSATCSLHVKHYTWPTYDIISLLHLFYLLKIYLASILARNVKFSVST